MTTPAELYATKSDYAYKQVRELILSGELEPGAVINQAMLAKGIGISTTPLREALRRLMQQGLVELDAHREARVALLNAEEARDLLEVRRSLDPLAAGLAAQRRTGEDIAEMQASLDALDVLPDNPTLAELHAHRRFHAAVSHASHNARLIGMVDGLWDTADRYRRLGLKVARSEDERAAKAQEHRLLLEAIIERDSDTASEIMLVHIQTSLGAKSAWRLAKPAAPSDLS